MGDFAFNSHKKLDSLPKVNSWGEESGEGQWAKTPLKTTPRTKEINEAEKSIKSGKFRHFDEIEVDPSHLHTTQETVSPEVVRKYIDNPSSPAGKSTFKSKDVLATRHGDKLVLADGNHRASAAKLRGDKIKIKVARE